MLVEPGGKTVVASRYKVCPAPMFEITVYRNMSLGKEMILAYVRIPGDVSHTHVRMNGQKQLATPCNPDGGAPMSCRSCVLLLRFQGTRKQNVVFKVYVLAEIAHSENQRSPPTSPYPKTAIRGLGSRQPDNNQQYSPENQLEIIRKYAAAHNMEIVQDYSDHGRSGLTSPAGTGSTSLWPTLRLSGPPSLLSLSTT